MPAFYYFITALAKTLFTLLTRWHVQGRERVPSQGPLIVVANHLNNADPAVLGASIPRMIVFMAKEELFDSWLKSLLIRGYCAFPVRKGRVDRAALTRAGAVLRQGQVLGMFPEGTRSDSQAQLQPAFRGAALLARRYQAPILPVGISGTERLNGFGWVFTRPRVTVEIGEPFMASDGRGESAREDLGAITDLIMARIAELLPPSYRGVYSDGSGARQESLSGG